MEALVILLLRFVPLLIASSGVIVTGDSSLAGSRAVIGGEHPTVWLNGAQYRSLLIALTSGEIM